MHLLKIRGGMNTDFSVVMGPVITSIDFNHTIPPGESPCGTEGKQGRFRS